MKRSVDSILTTHAGSLPRPDALRDAWSKPKGRRPLMRCCASR